MLSVFLSDVYAGVWGAGFAMYSGMETNDMLLEGLKQLIYSVLGRKFEEMYPTINESMMVKSQYLVAGGAAGLYGAFQKKGSNSLIIDAVKAAGFSYAGDLTAQFVHGADSQIGMSASTS